MADIKQRLMTVLKREVQLFNKVTTQFDSRPSSEKKVPLVSIVGCQVDKYVRSKATCQGNMFFEHDMGVIDVSFLQFSTTEKQDEVILRMYELGCKLNDENILGFHSLRKDDTRKLWFIGCGMIDEGFLSINYFKKTNLPNGPESQIMQLLKSIIYMHRHSIIHRDLDSLESYVIDAKSQKIQIRLTWRARESFSNVNKLEDLISFKNTMETVMKAASCPIDRGLKMFFDFFDRIPKHQVASGDAYGHATEQLVNHPFFKNSKTKMQYFLQIEQALKGNHLKYAYDLKRFLEDPTCEFVGWDQLLNNSKTPLLWKAYYTYKGTSYDTSRPRDLIRFLANVYCHERKRNIYDQLSQEVDSVYPDFLFLIYLYL